MRADLLKADYSAPEVLSCEFSRDWMLCGSSNGETENFDIEDYVF